MGHAMACLRRSEENLRDLVLSFLHVGSRIKVIKFDGWHLYPLRSLSGSFLPIPELKASLRWHLSLKLPFFCFCVPKLSVLPLHTAPLRWAGLRVIGGV